MTDKNRTHAKTILASIAILLVATACRNPFVGMGARVDLNPPTGDVTNVSSGDYISGELTLSGTIDDDTDPYAVSAVVTDPLDGTVDETIAGTINEDGTWEILIPDTGAAEFGKDGQKNVTVVLQDSSERTTELEMVFFFDNSNPVVMMTTPALNASQNTTSFYIRGEAYDPLGLASVTATVSGPVGSNPTILDDKNFGTPDSWLFTINHDLSSGVESFDISVVAIDRAGNTSTAMFHSADLAAVNDGDSVTVIDLYNLKEALTDYLSHLTQIVPAHLIPGATLPVSLPSGSDDLRLWDDGDDANAPFTHLSIDMDQDIPAITVTNPDPDAGLPGDRVGANYIISGRVKDNVSIDPTTLDIYFMDESEADLSGPDAVYSNWLPLEDIVSTSHPNQWYERVDDQNYNFSYQLPTFDDTSDATYHFKVRASDNNSTPKTRTTDSIPFFLDNAAPDLLISTPSQGSSTNDTGITISGTAKDFEALGIEIEISIRDEEGNDSAFVTIGTIPGDNTNQAWSYDLSDWAGIAGVHPVETINVTVRATSPPSTGTSVTTSTYFTLDQQAPDIEIITPEEGEDVNGAVTLRVSIDDNAINTVTRQIGTGAPVETVTASKAYWSYAFSTYDPLYADPASSGVATETFPGSGLWDLPITIYASDQAGNDTTEVRNIIIDNDGDRPEVSVLYPLNDTNPIDAVTEGGIFGGEVTISGLSDDDDNFGIVDSVVVQIDLNTTPAEVDALIAADWADWETELFQETVNLSDGIDFNDDGSFVTTINEYDEYEVDGTKTWSLTLNSTGELYSTEAGHDGNIFLKILAIDPENPSLKSAPELYHIKLDNTLPRIEKIRINDNYSYAQTNFSGTIQLQALISDTSAITNVDISADYGNVWQDVTYTALPGTDPDFDPAVDQVVINFSINTSGTDLTDDIEANDGAELITDGNGILVLKLRATDDNDPDGYVDIENISLNVDNDVPTTSMNTPGALAGTARLQGSAQDPIAGSGNISGISHIEVYLGYNNGGGFMVYNLHPSTPPYSFPPVPDGAVETLTFAGEPYPLDSSNLIIIDVDEDEGMDPLADGDMDGYNEEIVKDGSNWEWWVDFDSTRLPDGDIEVHYVVVDSAGNRQHYSQSGSVENNPPVISSVIMGTDVNNYDDLSNGTGVNTNVGEGESFLFTDGDGNGIIDTITIRNTSLYVNVATQGGTGNGSTTNWEWSLRYKGVDPNHLGTGVSTTTITSGFAGDLDADPHYILSVTDEANLTDSIRLNVNLDNTDGIAPVVILDNLTLVENPKILDYDANGYAVPGYVPSAISGIDPWASAEGRLRPAGSGIYDGTDADVSGKAIVSGTIYDANAIDRLELTISGYDGGNGIGAPFGALEWFNPTVPNPLGGVIPIDGSASGWTAYITSTGQSFDESTGHSVSWVFEFDTSDINTVAAADVNIIAEAYDRAGNVNTPNLGVSSDNYSIDVMPYIADIGSSNAGYILNNQIHRNKYGAWSIAEETYLIIEGFNLGTTVGLVSSDSVDPAIPDLTVAITVANDLDVTTLNTTKTQLTAQVSGFVNSGWLVMEVGTTGSEVPLMNYYGDFNENNIFDSTWTDDSEWTDDRYLSIWDVTGEMDSSDNAVWGDMDVSASNGSLWGSWSEYSSARVYVANEDTAYTSNMHYNDGGFTSEPGIFRIYDPSEYTTIGMNDSGSPYIAHLANFYGGSGDWDTGSGGLLLYGENADFWGWYNDGGGWTNYSPGAPYGNSAYGVQGEEVERFSQDQQLWQFKNPRMAVEGTDGDTDIHIAYYDANSKALKYSHFSDDGGSMYNQTFFAEETTTGNNTDNKQFIYENDIFDTNIIAGVAGENGSNVGLYSDIALDSGGRPVIVYYDTANAALRLIRATTDSPVDHDNSGATHWVDQAITADFSYIGMYPSISIASDDSVHISAYKVSSGDLKYFTAVALTSPASGAETYNFGDTTSDVWTVDEDGNLGKYSRVHLSYDLSGTAIPMIGYLNSSDIGTFSGLKYAFLRSDGNWDHGTVPLLNSISDAPISAVGIPNLLITPGGADQTNYSMAFGFHSSNYRYARLRPEL